MTGTEGACGPGPEAKGSHTDLAAFLAALRLGGPFAAHEVLEAPWRRPDDLLYRQDAVQALIQVCAAYVQRSRANARGARVLAVRAAERLGRPVDGAVEAVLRGVGIDRSALLRRLRALPTDTRDWPSPLDLLLGSAVEGR